MIEIAINLILLAFMAVIALAIVRMSDLFGMAMLFSLFSLLSAGVFTVMDAADVAFTEAAVGAGISTILMLATLAKTGRTEKKNNRNPIVPLLVVFSTGALLIFATSDLPRHGDPNAPLHQHVAPEYIENSPAEIGIPNVVTSVLASYRGYDTMGETAVIFTAGIGVLALLGLRRRRRSGPVEDSGVSAGGDNG
jgi:multicomponent Na+:H+ antiporter subunit B